VEEYLPPIVTKLKADLSDLVRGLAEAQIMVREFAAGAHKEIIDVMTDTGRDSGSIFANEFRKNSRNLLRNMEQDVGEAVRTEASRIAADTGRQAGKSFASSFTGLMWPLIIGALILLAPAIVTLIAGAIATGVGLGFVGLGIFLLREQPGLIAAAVSFKNTISEVFKDAAAPLLGPLIRALGILASVVRGLGPDFKEIFTSLAAVIEPLAYNFASFFTTMMPGLKEMLSHTEILSAFGLGLQLVGGALGEMFHEIATHGPEIANFMGDFMAGLANLIRALGSTIGFMAEAYQKMDDIHNQAVAQGWDTPWNAIKTGAGIAGNAVKTAIMTVGDWVSTTSNKVSTAVSGWFDRAGTFIGSWVDRIANYFKALPGKIWDAITALPGILGKAAMDAFDAFFYWTGFGVVRIIQYIEAFPDALGRIVVRAWDFATNAFNAGVDKVVTTAQTLPSRVTVWFDNLKDRIVTWAEKTYWALMQWIERAILDVVHWFETLPARASKALEDFWKMLKDGLREAGKWLYEAGKNLLFALVSGFIDSVEAGINIVKRAIEKIKEGAREALGIKSPSTVFEEMGRYSMQGYIKGVFGERGALTSLWDKLQMPGISMTPMTVLAGAAASGGTGASGYAGPAMVHTVVQVDGSTIVEAITPAAQQRKSRFGTTGLS